MISLSIGDKLAIYFLHSPCILSWRRLISFHSFWNPCDHLPHPPPPTSSPRQAIDNHCSLRMSRFLELKSISLMKQKKSSSANFPSLFSNQCTVFWFPWHFHGVPPMYHKITFIYLTWTCSFCSLFSIQHQHRNWCWVTSHDIKTYIPRWLWQNFLHLANPSSGELPTGNHDWSPESERCWRLFGHSWWCE